MRRIVLLGSSGRLGTALQAEFTRRAGQRIEWAGTKIIAPARTDPAFQRANAAETWQHRFAEWKPDVVINCIALSDVDRCEREPRAAQECNRDLPAALAEATRAHGARLIHFSTDFVFDGTLRRPYREDDTPQPLSTYASTKLAGERAIEAANDCWWIFRVSWLYGGPSRNLAATLLDPAHAGRAIALADDRFGVPNPVQLIAREVAEAIERIGTDCVAPDSGVYHLSCHGATTWYEFGQALIARAIATGRIAPDHAPLIEAFPEKTRPRPARRPVWSVLDPALYESVFARKLPEWRDAIDFIWR